MGQRVPMAARLVFCCGCLAAVASAPGGDARAQTVLAAPAVIQFPAARLAGQGSFRWFGLKIYDARLLVGDRGYDPALPSAYPFALELRYALKLKGSKIAQASIAEMRKLPGGASAPYEQWRQVLEALFPDVEANSRLTALYLPGQPTRFFLDDVAIGQIDDRELARRFFAIWLDPATSAPGLRDDLLKNAAARP